MISKIIILALLIVLNLNASTESKLVKNIIKSGKSVVGLGKKVVNKKTVGRALGWSKKLLKNSKGYLKKRNAKYVSKLKSKFKKLPSFKIMKRDRRRITKIEQNLINSKNAKKLKINNRTVMQRNVFPMSKKNIKRMKTGKAPFGYDGEIVNLHHLKQQNNGILVEMSKKEHLEHSKILHRYTKKSEINRDAFNTERVKYWQSRAISYVARGK